MNPAQQPTPLSFEEKHILRALLYFDIFNYPLLPEEIRRFSQGASSSNLHQQLFQLRRRGLIHHIHPFYTLQNNPNVVKERLAGNSRARRQLRIAHLVSRFLSHFPFVRALMISGSLSKGVAGPDSDIDFFVITHPGRLWLVRGLLAVFKRVFMFNSHRYFCANYFIDTRHMELDDKNIFTAIEAATLVPTYGVSWFNKFIDANRWIYHRFPNCASSINQNYNKNNRDSILKRMLEKILGIRAFDKLDRFILHLARKRFKRIYGSLYSPTVYELAFRSRPGVSKNHPSNYQAKILTAFDEKLRNFEQQFEINLAS